MCVAHSWLTETHLEAESFVLKATGIADPEEFSRNHSAWLVSVKTNPNEAAHWWHWQKDKVSEPGEGWISLRIHDTELMPLDGWTNIFHFWYSIIGVLDSFQTKGVGVGNFSNEVSEFSLTKKGNVAIFEIRSSKTVVDPKRFTVQLAQAANDFFQWMDEYVGGVTPDIFARLARLSETEYDS